MAEKFTILIPEETSFLDISYLKSQLENKGIKFEEKKDKIITYDTKKTIDLIMNDRVLFKKLGKVI